MPFIHVSLNPHAPEIFPNDVIISGNIIKFSPSNFFDMATFIPLSKHLASRKDSCVLSFSSK